MGGRVMFSIAVIGAVASMSLGEAAQGAESQAAVAARSCGTVTYTGMTVRLKVRGAARCSGARRVALRYADKVDGGDGCPTDGGNTCPLPVGSFRCTTPTAGLHPLVLSCRSRRLKARIKGYEVEAGDSMGREAVR
jgi:hypothetical protein